MRRFVVLGIGLLGVVVLDLDTLPRVSSLEEIGY